MSRIILISNRVSDLDTAVQAGGVSVAIADILTSQSAIWFGWNGQVSDQPASEFEMSVEAIGQSRLVTTPLSADEFRDFYLGYSNSVLWPVFHNRLDLAQFDAGFYPEYLRVNQRFAEAVQALIAPGDILWIHDYHLIPLARELRKLGVVNAIGYFLHIPVPPAQAFLAIPEHEDLAHALAEYDVVGLQTEQDVGNLIASLQQAVGARLLPDGRMRVGSRPVKVVSLPVGIDAREFAADIDLSGAPSDGVEFRMIGIDRLDYTKGLPQKFRAFGRFLKDNPEYWRRVVLSQIAPPTRETLEAYSDIRAELESLAGSINGAYSEFDWTPLVYMHRAVSRGQLFSIYRSSQVGVVTPLRDGMNLVAKEYVAAQDPANPGVLILSRFAGAADQMKAALIVNPYNIDETAHAMGRAIAMPLKERQERHSDLLDAVMANDNNRWVDTFLELLASAAASERVFTGDEQSPTLVKWRGMLSQRYLPVLP